MRIIVSSVVMLLLSSLYLSACGQKGALFLPGDPSQLQSVPAIEEMPDETDDDDPDDEEDSATEQS